METNTRTVTGALLAALLLGTFNTTSALAASTAGTVIFAVGDAWILAEGSNQKRVIKHGERISDRDALMTGPDGHVHLRMVDKAFIALRPNSQLKLEEYSFEHNSPAHDRARLLLKSGSMRSVSGKLAQRSKERYRLNTPVAAIGVRGTDYTVITTAKLSEVDVLQGGIAMSPFNAGCSAKSLGPCKGDSVVDLYANMNQHYLQLRSGDMTPNLMDGRLNNLSRPEDASSLKRISKTTSIPALNTAEENTASAAPDTPATTDETNTGGTSGKPPITNSTENSESSESSDELISETADRDGDGVADLLDRFPEDKTEQLDTDGDGIGNNQDHDDDNDGLSDLREQKLGTNPLLADSDGDSVPDNADSRPTHADGIVIEQQGERHVVSEAVFSTLNVQEVSISNAEEKNTSGVLYKHTIQLASNPNPNNELTLTRTRSADGRIFWGAEGSSQAWDSKIKNQLGAHNYQHWSTVSGLSQFLYQQNHSAQDIHGQSDRWDAYYKRGAFAPLVANDTLYLSNVNGLEAASTPVINDFFPSLGQNYDLTASEVQLSNGRNTPIAAQVADFQFSMLYPNQAFEASIWLSIPGREDIKATFKGTVNESGMVFGGTDNAYLKGFFVNQMQQVALIFETEKNGFSYTGTLITERNEHIASSKPVTPVFETYQSEDSAPVKWGRWSNFAEINDREEVQQALQGDKLIAQNRVFALMRSNEDVVLPSEGVFSFTMTDSEAIYKRGDHIETASIDAPSLTVDFNQRSFETQLTITSPSLTGGVDINASGNLGSNGVFSSNALTSNSNVSGALTNHGLSAGMIFERELENGFVSGAAEWAH